MKSKKLITLQFASFEDLWHFKQSANVTSFEIIRSNNILTFSSTERQKEIATTIYKATIRNVQKENKEKLR